MVVVHSDEKTASDPAFNAVVAQVQESWRPTSG
jgi:hypothetical protein